MAGLHIHLLCDENQVSTYNIHSDLPELTILNLLAEIRNDNIKYPKIVLAQAILETGWFRSLP